MKIDKLRMVNRNKFRHGYAAVNYFKWLFRTSDKFYTGRRL